MDAVCASPKNSIHAEVTNLKSCLTETVEAFPQNRHIPSSIYLEEMLHCVGSKEILNSNLIIYLRVQFNCLCKFIYCHMQCFPS